MVFLGIMVPVCVVLIKVFYRDIYLVVKNVEIINMLIMIGIPFIPTTIFISSRLSLDDSGNPHKCDLISEAGY